MVKKEKLWWANQYLLFGALLVVVLYFARLIIIPVVFAALLAMLMSPVSNYFEQRGFKRHTATFLCVLILLGGFLIIFSIVFTQISSFLEQMPLIVRKVHDLAHQVQVYIKDNFKVYPASQMDFVNNKFKYFTAFSGSQLFDLVEIITTTIAGLMLTLVYTYLFLFQKERYFRFILKLYKDHESEEIKSIIQQISSVSQRYLTGRAFSVLILATLYAIGLLSIGLENAILLACIAAILTIIPYVGTFIGGLFPFTMALISDESTESAMWVAGILIFIQTIDNYFIEPNVVGREVNLNAFSSIFIMIVGGLLWGIPGMILFVPILAILKIVFDHVESLKPYGYLIGRSATAGFSLHAKLKIWATERLELLFSKIRARKLKEKSI